MPWRHPRRAPTSAFCTSAAGCRGRWPPRAPVPRLRLSIGRRQRRARRWQRTVRPMLAPMPRRWAKGPAVTFEEIIGVVIEAKLAPFRAEMGRLTAEIEAMRRALPPTLVPIPEAAEALGVSVSTLRRRIDDGSIRAHRVGRAVRVDLTELRAPAEAEVVRLAQRAMTSAV